MWKFILLAAVFAALVPPSTQLRCYACRSSDYLSLLPAVNKLPICEKDLSKSDQIIKLPDAEELACKKVVEKQTVDGVKHEYLIRYFGVKGVTLNNTIFEEYTCYTDLCNSATTMSLAIFAIVIPFATIFASHV